MKWLLPLLVLMNLAWANQEIKMSVTALNSPVSEAAILLKLEPSKEMIFKDVNVRIKNKSKPPFRERIKDYPVEKQGASYLLKLPTRDYPVDQYEILVIAKTDTRRVWEIWKSAPPVAKGFTTFVVKTHQIIVDGDPQPPHPGEAGLETLAGIDSDSDGVRDDIEIWINEKYSTQPSIRKGLKQLAKALGEAMVTANDPPASILTTHKLFRAGACLHWIIGLDKSIEFRKELNFEFLNTKERIKSYLQGDKNFHGQSTPDDMEIVHDRNDKKIFCEAQDINQVE